MHFHFRRRDAPPPPLLQLFQLVSDGTESQLHPRAEPWLVRLITFPSALCFPSLVGALFKSPIIHRLL